MNINLTLVLQVIHFGFAYVIIAVFFLKPVIKVLFEEEQQERKLLHIIDEHKQELSDLKDERYHIWYNASHFFSHNAPSLKDQQRAFSVETQPKAFTQPENDLIHALSDRIAVNLGRIHDQ